MTPTLTPAIDKDGSIRLVRMEGNSSTGHAIAEPVHVFTFAEACDFGQKFADAIRLAQPIDVKVREIARLRDAANEMEAELHTAPRLTVEPS